MTEMEPWEEDMDRLLRSSMAAAPPDLSADFERKLMSELDNSSKQLDKYRSMLVSGYVLVSALSCIVIMRGEGLDWPAIALLLLCPLALVAAVPSLLRLFRPPVTRVLP